MNNIIVRDVESYPVVYFVGDINHAVIHIRRSCDAVCLWISLKLIYLIVSCTIGIERSFLPVVIGRYHWANPFSGHSYVFQLDITLGQQYLTSLVNQFVSNRRTVGVGTYLQGCITSGGGAEAKGITRKADAVVVAIACSRHQFHLFVVFAITSSTTCHKDELLIRR